MTATKNIWRLFQAIVWGPLRASYGRTLLSIIAIALGVALGISIYVMTQGATTEMAQAARRSFGEADLVIQGTGQGFDEALYPTIALIPGVAVASPVVQIEAPLVGSSGSIILLGTDLFRVARLRNMEMASNKRSDLAFFEPHNLQLSGPAAQALNLKSGDHVTVQVGMQLVTFTVFGVLPTVVEPRAVGFLDIAAAQWRLNRLGLLTRIDVRLTAGADLNVVQTAITKVLPANVKVTTLSEVSQQSLKLTRPFTINLTVLALVALFTGAFLVYSTQSLAIIRRRREFALLHALGLTTKQQIASVISMGALLGIVGAILGVLLGVALATTSFKLFLGTMAMTNGIPQLHVSHLTIGAFLFLGVLVAMAGSVAPALAAARIPTSQALKAGNIDDSQSHGRTLWGALLWLLAPLVLLLPPIFGLPLAGYAAIAFILLGAVLMIPAFTRQLLSWLPRGRNVSYQTAIAQLQGSAHSATVSVATMLVSVSLMVAMAIMVTSLRGSLISYLNKTFPADIYLLAAKGAYFDAVTVNTLKEIPSIERITTSRSTTIRGGSDRAPITLIAQPLSEDNAADALLLESKAQQALPAGTIPIWISASLAAHHRLAADSQFQFSLADQDIIGSVRGITSNVGPTVDALYIDEQRYRQLTHDDRANRVALWVKPNTSAEITLNAVRAQMPHGAAIEVGTPSEVRARSLHAFDQAFAITYLLVAVAVLIGLFGISVSASAQALARRAEFGVLRHLGFTRSQIGSLLVIEGIGLGALGILGSLVVGGTISVILVRVVSRQLFHSSMQLQVPVVPLLALTLIVPLTAALTALWSGRNAMGLDVIKAVKEDW